MKVIRYDEQPAPELSDADIADIQNSTDVLGIDVDDQGHAAGGDQTE